MFDKESIEAVLKTNWAARDLAFFQEIDSTNDVAKEAGFDGKASGFLVVADKQVAGRGSRGRSWESPAGNNVFMSIMVRPEIPLDKVSGLTLVMALSISEGIDELIARRALSDADGKELVTGIKWPNDIVLNKRKICGILTELHMLQDGEGYFVVIGVGINVNQPRELFPEQLQSTAGSVFSETGEKLDRAELIALCMKYFEKNYEMYIEHQNLEGLRESYEKRLINIGKEVRILDPKGEYEAVAEGVTKEGALIIVKADGKREVINAGEVSVRGLYGYV